MKAQRFTQFRLTIKSRNRRMHMEFLQAANAIPKIFTCSRQSGHSFEPWRVIQGKAVAEVRNGIVVCVHLLAHIPLLACRAVAVLLDPAIANMVLPPPPLIPLPCPIHAPRFSLCPASLRHRTSKGTILYTQQTIIHYVQDDIAGHYVIGM